MSPSNYSYVFQVKRMVLERYEYVNPEIAAFIACLSALETSYGLSLVYKENHNLFGMKFPKVRLTCAIGENRGHSKYSSDMASICDFFYWLQFNGFNQNHLKGKFDSFVKKFRSTSYNPSYSYTDTILKIMSNFNSSIND